MPDGDTMQEREGLKRGIGRLSLDRNLASVRVKLTTATAGSQTEQTIP